jgi:hypothetical protein
MLRKELDIRSVSLESLPIDRVEIRRWDIEKVAFALARQPGARRSAAECPARREWAIQADLRDALDEAFRNFVDRMDPQAMQKATRGRRFDERIYNYLAHREYQQYRLQFARTFPGLLVTAVVAEPRSFGEELRSIVDSGAPLIKGLAARWNVRPGVIRHLVGRASSDMGIQWARDAKGLALALNALHPQDLPGDSATEWSEFNRIVATGQRLFLRPVWESPAGLEWLRECVRRMKRGDRRALDVWMPGWNELAKVDDLRAALTECLQRETASTPPRPASDTDTAITDAIDRAVLRMAHRGLSEVASLFSDELERRRKKGGTIREILDGDALLPLVPEDFISSDGMTRVTALTTTRQLRTHGTRMRNCLRHRSTRGVASKAAIGTVFIVGLYDAHFGKPLSTAEIKIVPDREAGAYRLITKEHTAFANRAPTRRCQCALREFLHHCQSDDVREHLKSNWKKIRQSRGESGTQPVNLPAALRCTLGEQFYEGLVSSSANRTVQG